MRAPILAKRRTRLLFEAASKPALVCALFCASACDSPRERDTKPTASAASIDPALTHQHISGFGASSAWTLPNASEKLADQFFSTENGIGLSLLRLRITPAGTTSELETAKKAVARGARVWAAPWSPPGAWKTTGTDEHGGKLFPERYADWAGRLATFARTLSDEGVPLIALSAQNEPNWVAEWETCEWSPAELRTFIRDYLGPALVAQGLELPILAPETNDWHSISRYAEALLGDPVARAFVGPIATHSYGGRAFDFSTPQAHGKEFWQTEFSDSGTERDSGMGSALRVARLIHEQLTVAQVNAWHYWWLVPLHSDDAKENPGLTQNGELTRRAYVLGNWSRFVRPGFLRVEATKSPQPGVSVTAFQSALGDQLVLVAINDSPIDREQKFTLRRSAFRSVTPWVTSDALALAPQEPIAVQEDEFDSEDTGDGGADSGFSAILGARSVTSFVLDSAGD